MFEGEIVEMSSHGEYKSGCFLGRRSLSAAGNSLPKAGLEQCSVIVEVELSQLKDPYRVNASDISATTPA